MAKRYNITQNSDYLKEIEGINKSYMAYNDDPAIIPKIILQHRREDEKDYKERTKRAFRPNYYKFIIKLYFKNIFNSSRQVERDLGDNLDKYIDNIDLRDNNMDTFMGQVGRHSMLSGQSYIWVDQDTNSDGSLGRPFAKIIPFNRVLDWELSYNQEFEWVLIELEETKRPPLGVQKTNTEYILFTKTYWALLDNKGEVKEEGDNALGVVPVVRAWLWDDDTNGFGEGLYKSLLKIDNEFTNILSLYQTEFYKNLFNVLCIPDMSTPDDKLRMTISEHAYVRWDGEKNAPQYLAPATTTFEEKREYMNFLINEMLRLSGFKGRDEAVVLQSGVAKMYDFLSTNETLRSTAKRLQQIETKIWYLMNLYLLKPVEFTDFVQKNTITYADTFDPINVKEELPILDELIMFDYSKTATKEAKRIRIKKTIEDYLNEEKIAKIDLELDSDADSEEHHSVGEDSEATKKAFEVVET